MSFPTQVTHIDNIRKVVHRLTHEVIDMRFPAQVIYIHRQYQTVVHQMSHRHEVSYPGYIH